MAAYRDKVRAKVFDHYGWSCACCGATERLTIDHVNGDGAAHRIELYGTDRGKGGVPFYAWLVRQGFPPGYQTLCLSCNSSKQGGDRCRLDHGGPRRSVGVLRDRGLVVTLRGHGNYVARRGPPA